MASKKPTVDDAALDPDKVMAGVLALLVAEREERLSQSDDPRKTEVILGTAGFGAAEIARLTGKSRAAVQKTLQRARGKR